MLPKPIKPPRPRKRQQESANQRTFVKALMTTGLGFFYRVKNMGTFDPTRGFYRKDYGTALVAIPDICGYVERGRSRGNTQAIPVYIEVKYIQNVEKKKKSIFACRITDQQKEFLHNAHISGCRSGIAFNMEDCFAIAYDNEITYPRHPRTWMFLPKAELDLKVAQYENAKKALSRLKQDPVACVTTLVRGEEPSSS